nr:immunoglobulin light chain junction region [Macaca mulatta]
CAIRHSSGYIF